MNRCIAAICVIVLATSVSSTAFAYVGPGAGLSLLGALWGLAATVVAALAFLIALPVRRWRRRHRAQQQAMATSQIQDAQQR